jgi:hypothetical protein
MQKSSMARRTSREQQCIVTASSVVDVDDDDDDDESAGDIGEFLTCARRDASVFEWKQHTPHDISRWTAPSSPPSSSSSDSPKHSIGTHTGRDTADGNQWWCRVSHYYRLPAVLSPM